MEKKTNHPALGVLHFMTYGFARSGSRFPKHFPEPIKRENSDSVAISFFLASSKSNVEILITRHYSHAYTRPWDSGLRPQDSEADSGVSLIPRDFHGVVLFGGWFYWWVVAPNKCSAIIQKQTRGICRRLSRASSRVEQLNEWRRPSLNESELPAC